MNIPRFDGSREEHPHVENTFSEKRKIYLIIQKVILSVLFLCLLLSLETTWLSGLRLPYLGKAGQGSPALGFLFVLAVACLLGERDGCVAGGMAGFMYECLTGSGFMLLPLFYALVGYGVGWISKKFLAQNIPSFLIYAVIGSLAECLRLYVYACIGVGGLVPYQFLLYSLLPRFVWTVVFALGVYVPVRGVQKVMNKK